MRLKKWLSVFLLIASIVFLVAFWGADMARWSMDWVYDFYQQAGAYPSEGRYRCEELDAMLEFSGPEITACFSGGEEFPLYILAYYSLQFTSNEPLLHAHYHWMQNEDVVVLRIADCAYPFDPKMEYRFVRIS